MVDVMFLIAAAVLALVGGVAIAVGLWRNRPTEEVKVMHTPDEAITGVLGTLVLPERCADHLGGELGPLASATVADKLEARLRDDRDFAIRILGSSRISGGTSGKHATYELWKKVGSSFGDRFQMRFGYPGEHEKERPKHFAIIDGETLLVEDRHEGHRWPRTLRTYGNSPLAVRRFEDFFDAMWASPHKVARPTVVQCPGPQRGERILAEAE